MRDRRQKKKPVVSVLKSSFRKGLSSIASLFSQKFTVMLIPHSEKKVLNFQVSTLLILFVAVVLLGMSAGFFYMTTQFSGTDQIISEQENNLLITQGNLDSVLDEVNNLVQVYELFENTMNTTLEVLDPSASVDGQIPGGGDLASIRDLQEIQNGEAREIYDLRRLQEALNGAISPLSSISSVIEAQRQLLTDLPTFWPVTDGRTAVTMEYGANIHPIHDNWYLHKGIDIAGTMGLPIRAAANGKVLESELDLISGYGNFVLIEHKYGFKTRYSHMSSRLVRVGEEVVQGQQIGTLGSTGLSTGPHLDFQIMLGTEVLDPASFLKIQNSFTRWTGTR